MRTISRMSLMAGAHMRMSFLRVLVAGFFVGLVSPGTVQAADILCLNPSENHMLIDDAYVSACLDAGFDDPSLTGNPMNDVFLTGVGGAYTSIGTGSFAQLTQSTSGSTGTFSLDPTLWNTYSQIAIGFHFGTGHQPDNWFVYSLNSLISSGFWEFVNVNGLGGGLSGVRLYGIPGTTTVPEPASVVLLLMGLGAGVAFRARFAG